MFSPPYYSLEMYPGENQSTTLYKTYEEWLEKYWKQTIKLCKKVLSENGRMCYIVSDIDKKLIVNDMNKITEKYFTLVETFDMNNSKININKNKNKKEQIFLYQLKNKN